MLQLHLLSVHRVPCNESLAVRVFRIERLEAGVRVADVLHLHLAVEVDVALVAASRGGALGEKPPGADWGQLQDGRGALVVLFLLSILYAITCCLRFGHLERVAVSSDALLLGGWGTERRVVGVEGFLHHDQDDRRLPDLEHGHFVLLLESGRVQDLEAAHDAFDDVNGKGYRAGEASS